MHAQSNVRTKLVEIFVPAIASVVIALITALSTVAVGSKDLKEARESADRATTETTKLVEQADALRASLATSAVPIGAVLASPLTPDEFAQAAGDPPVFDPTKSKWSLADSRQAVGSMYHRLANGRSLPDLRGLFLRGMNAGRADAWKDPDDTRSPWIPQGWTTALPRSDLATSPAGDHTHTGPSGGQGFVGGGQGKHESGRHDGPAYGAVAMGAGGGHTHTMIGGDQETRPSNAAVFYYVRINP